jgi:hypothetical protein
MGVAILLVSILGSDCNRNGVEDSLDIAPAIRFEPFAELVTPILPYNLFSHATGPGGGAGLFDADGDGLADLVVADTGCVGSASVYLARPDGTFLPSCQLPTPPCLRSIVGADLDGDGLMDLAAASTEFCAIEFSYLLVLLNGGDGGFGEGTKLSRGVGPREVTAGDLDGDGDLDLAMVSQNPILSVWKNGGTARFERRTQLQIEAPAEDIAVSDLDGDGVLEIVTADPYGVGIFRNLGGSPERAVRVPGGGIEIHPDDFDGDGRPDLALRTVLEFSLLWNGGGLGFPTASCYRSENEIQFSAVGDLDSDARPDLLWTYHELPVVGFLQNRGGRTFSREPDFATGSTVRGFSAADFDGDGRRDIAFGHLSTVGVTVLANRTDPATSRDDDRNGLPDECQGTFFVRGDANADGSMDMADAVFTLSHLYLAGEPPSCPESADADDSGSLDLADGVRVLEALFLGGPSPPEPFPRCGEDPTDDGLGCPSHPPCAAGRR